MSPLQFEVNIKKKSSCLCTVYNNGVANVMIIDNVFTKENERNKGFGTKLMNLVIKKARELNIDSIELVVNLDNTSAHKLYNNVGFEKTSKLYFRKILNKF